MDLSYRILNITIPVCFSCLKKNFPLSRLDDPTLELVFPWIDVDGGMGIRQAMLHIVEQGHRKIGALAWPLDFRVGNNRMEGYFSVLQELGILLEEAWV